MTRSCIIAEYKWLGLVLLFGGYQVCDKWLKDRKGRFLSLDEIKHYCRVATAIAHTIELQKEIDKIYGDAEKELLVI